VDPFDDSIRFRVDDGDLVTGLNVREHAIGRRVELDVACLPPERDGRDPVARGRDHGLDASAFVRDEDASLYRVVGEPVRILAGRRPCENGAGSCVDRQHLARIRR